MKFMGGLFLYLIILTTALLFSAACNRPRSSPEEEAEFQRLVLGAIALKQSMRNPDSFVVESASIVDGGPVACYVYRAQNGFGGMNRGRAVLAGGSLKTSEMAGFANLWNKSCANKSGKDKANLLAYALRQ